MESQIGLLEQADLLWEHGSGLSLAIRESRRARHFILQILPPETVEVVVPKGTRPGEIQKFVEENRLWLDQARDELTARFGSNAKVLPDRIPLAAIGQSIDVRYKPGGASGSPRVRQRAGVMTLSTTEDETDLSIGLLKKWLLKQGKTHLVPWLGREAVRLGMVPGRVQVRLQRTRWGSCSGNGTISLNASLMLVRPELVRYLFVHELCHLKYLNHSARYWRAVARYEPDYQALDLELAEVWGDLPYWVFRAARAKS